MDKLWEIQMVNNSDELQFNIIEYDVVKSECLSLNCLALKNPQKPNSLTQWFELRHLEFIFISDFPWAYTRDFSHIQELEVKLCEAKAEYHKYKIEGLQQDIQEENKQMERFENYAKELKS